MDITGGIPREVLAEVMCAGLGCSGGTPEERISELYDRGITVGTRPTDGTQSDQYDAFDPDASTTNGHLVAFLSRVEEVLGGNNGGNNNGGNNGGGNNGGGNNGGNNGGNPPINTPLPTITVSGPSSGVSETSSSVGFTVRLSHRYPQNVYVTVETVDGTATAGSDYNPLYGRLTIRANYTSAAITPTLIDDTTSEPDETFSVRISNPTNAILGNTTEATATILDNEVPMPGLVTNLTMDCSTVGDTGDIHATWDPPATGTAPDGYQWEITETHNWGGWADWGNDYDGRVTATGAPGWDTYTVSVTAFSRVNNNNVNFGTHASLIVDCQEPPPTVSFSTTSLAVNEGGTVDITATLDKAACRHGDR